jgi:hypothetical protein
MKKTIFQDLLNKNRQSGAGHPGDALLKVLARPGAFNEIHDQAPFTTAQ